MKKWYQSRTIWLNVVSTGLEIFNTFSGSIPPGVITIVTNLGNIVLRCLTSQAIGNGDVQPGVNPPVK